MQTLDQPLDQLRKSQALIEKSNQYVAGIVRTEQWSEGFALRTALKQIYEEEEEVEKAAVSARLLHHSSANPVFRYGH